MVALVPSAARNYRNADAAVPLPDDFLDREVSAEDGRQAGLQEWCKQEVLSQSRQRSDLAQLRDEAAAPNSDRLHLGSLAKDAQHLDTELKRRRDEAVDTSTRRTRASAALADLSKQIQALASTRDGLPSLEKEGRSQSQVQAAQHALDRLLKRAKAEEVKAQAELKGKEPAMLKQELIGMEAEFVNMTSEIARLRTEQIGAHRTQRVLIAALQDEDAFVADTRSICNLADQVYGRMHKQVFPMLHGIVEQAKKGAEAKDASAAADDDAADADDAAAAAPPTTTPPPPAPALRHHRHKHKAPPPTTTPPPAEPLDADEEDDPAPAAPTTTPAPLPVRPRRMRATTPPPPPPPPPIVTTTPRPAAPPAAPKAPVALASAAKDDLEGDLDPANDGPPPPAVARKAAAAAPTAPPAAPAAPAAPPAPPAVAAVASKAPSDDDDLDLSYPASKGPAAAAVKKHVAKPPPPVADDLGLDDDMDAPMPVKPMKKGKHKAAAAQPSPPPLPADLTDFKDDFKDDPKDDLDDLPPPPVHKSRKHKTADMEAPPPDVSATLEDHKPMKATKGKKKKVHDFHDQTSGIMDLVQTPMTYSAWHPEHTDANLAASAKSELLAAEQAFDKDDAASFLQVDSEQSEEAQAQKAGGETAGLVLEQYAHSLGSEALLQLARAKLSIQQLKALWHRVRAPLKENPREAKAKTWCKDFQKESLELEKKALAGRVAAAVKLSQTLAQHRALESEAAARQRALEVFQQGTRSLVDMKAKQEEQASAVHAVLRELRREVKRVDPTDAVPQGAPAGADGDAPEGPLEALGRASGLASAGGSEMEDIIGAALARRTKAENAAKAGLENVRSKLRKVAAMLQENRRAPAPADHNLRNQYRQMCGWMLESIEARKHRDEGERDAIRAALAVVLAH